MKYILGFFVTILLLIVLVLVLVSGGNDDQPVPDTSKALSSYANTQAVTRLTIDGPITAPAVHRATRISVSQTSTVIEQLRGYDGEVIDLQTFPNTQASYRTFLRSLELAGFTKGDTSDNLKNDRGYCPLGSRYIYELNDGSEQLQRFWSTTCRGTKTYQGEPALTLQLFKNQVPNYSRVTNAFERSYRLSQQP